MIKFGVLALLLGLSCLLTAQTADNMTFLGQWDDPTLPTRDGLVYNEIWGYYDAGSGKEYAIIGSVQKVHIYDVSDPSSISLVDEFTGGDDTIWRDMKTYGPYLYCVADEGNEGMMIIDMTDMASGPVLAAQLTTHFVRAHNVFVDEAAGRLYVAGSNGQNNGLIIYDLTSNPTAPTLLASIALEGEYVHDLYARNNIAYCNHGSNGLYIYDLSTASTPVTIAALTIYPEKGYNHSSWLTDDGTHLVFCDETHGRGVKILDVSDLDNLTIKDIFRSQLMAPTFTNSIAHNPLILGNLAYVAYYHDGIQVFDISDPSDVTRVGYFDTYTDHTNYAGYDGAWGVYPFLPSGHILAADVLNGLFVVELGGASLPVEWLAFSAKAVDEKVELNWTTASETNSASFIVERSTDGQQFESIGTLKGAGTTHLQQSYMFWDEKPWPGRNYYRLQQVDFDGSSTYSKVIEVTLDQGTFVVFPNPGRAGSTQYLYLPVEEGEAMVELINVAGQIVWEDAVVVNAGRAEWIVPSVASGGYVLRVVVEGLVYQVRSFKLR